MKSEGAVPAGMSRKHLQEGLSMQAKNGSASPRRTRGGLVGCMLFALAVMALVIAPRPPTRKRPLRQTGRPRTSDYIALGDSISFGSSAERFNIHAPTESPSFFEEGVASDALKLLRKDTGEKTMPLVNNACPGETSNGLIGEATNSAANPQARPTKKSKAKRSNGSARAATRASATGTRARTPSATTCRCTTAATSKRVNKSPSSKRR